jgi:hypothetical protein
VGIVGLDDNPGGLCNGSRVPREGYSGVQIVAALVPGLSCGIWGLSLLAVAEGIRLAIDVESNTRTTNDLLGRLVDSKKRTV